jgi:hypothetical protein
MAAQGRKLGYQDQIKVDMISVPLKVKT